MAYGITITTKATIAGVSDKFPLCADITDLQAGDDLVTVEWTADNPAIGQCNVTALLIHELFGGDLLKTPLPAGNHFYNRIEGRRYDFTASQFDQPIAYMDLLTSRAEAEQAAASGQLAELRAAFRKHSTRC